MHLRTRLFVAAAATALLLPVAGLRADDDTGSPIDPVEDRALREEARAEFEQALDSFSEAMSMAVEAASQADDGGAAARLRARAETYLEKIDELQGRTSDHRKVEEYLSSLDREKLGPNLAGWVDWHRVKYLRKAGQTAASGELLRTLGFVTNWWVVGPFDNERGRGMAAKAGPEGEDGLVVDLQADYQGKERNVAWRPVPAVHPYGWIDLDAMMRPNDQALAYAVTWLRVDEKTPVALRFGSDEGLVAWVNGTEVLRRDIHRRGGFDQDIVGVELQPGWNRVLLKVGENIGGWGFRMRVTDTDGNALTDLSGPATPEELEVAAVSPETGAEAVTTEVARGALDALESAAPRGETAEDGSDDARAYFWLGVLHRSRQYDDQKEEQSDRKYFERAMTLRPDDAIYRFHFAESASRPIEMSVEKEENEQRRGREKALELDPSYAQAYLALANYYTFSLPKLPKAEELCRKALAINDAYLEAHLLLVSILDRRGFDVEAEVHLRSVLAREEFADRTRHLEAVARHGTGQGLLKAAREGYRRTLEVDHEDASARERLADVLMREGLAEDAVGVFDERLRLNPFDLDAARRKAWFLEGLERYAESAAVAAEGLAIAPEDEQLIDLQARVLHRMGKQDDAVAAWKEALRVNPKNAVLKRYVEWLDPTFKPFELPFVEDAGTLLAAVAGREADNAENDPSVVVLDKAVTKVNPDGTNSVFTQKIVKVLNNRGVKSNTFYAAGSFWASDQAFEWRTARVWRKDGTVEEAQVQSGSPWVRWPKLEPGDAWEVQHRVDQLRQTFFGDYFGDRWIFTDQVPVLRSEYVLLTPADREYRFHTRRMPEGTAEPDTALKDEGKTKLYRWRLTDLEKVRFEPAMPSWLESQPMVEVTTYQSWDHFSNWWWNLIKKQFTVDDAMKEKVAELVEGKETRLEKVQAIYDFVVTDIQYQAWEFGVHGYKPYTATSIFHRKWGDCKDKAILIRTMLQEVDIEAYPVLIMATNNRSEEDLSLAQVGHFNHCIAYVPDADGKGNGMFLDGTAQYNSMHNVPSMDRGAEVLIVKPDGAERVQIPWNTPDEFRFGQEYAIDLAADGSAEMKGKASFTGDFSVMARNMFSVEGRRPLILNSMMTPAFGPHEVRETRFPDLKDISEPRVDVEVDFKVARLGEIAGDRMSIPLKFIQFPIMQSLGRVAALEEREHDLVLGNPMSMGTDALLRRPAGWVVETLPADRKVETPFGEFTIRIEDTPEGLVFKRDVRLTTGRVLKDDYAAFREFVSTFTNATTEKIVLKRAEEFEDDEPATDDVDDGSDESDTSDEE